jgi:hypothetical protein
MVAADRLSFRIEHPNTVLYFLEGCKPLDEGFLSGLMMTLLMKLAHMKRVDILSSRSKTP